MSELQFNFPFSFTIYLNLWNPFYLPEAGASWEGYPSGEETPRRIGHYKEFFPPGQAYFNHVR